MAFEITIPRLGWSMEEGTFAGWMKKDGDAVRRGDALFELEGEKALQEIEALDDGVLRIAADGPQSGAVLKVGAVIGYLLADGDVLPQSHSATGVASTVPENSLSKTAIHSATESTGTTVSASPTVRRLARELGILLSEVTPTGAEDRITDDDVRLAATQKSAIQSIEPSTSKNVEVIATPRARRLAKRTRLELSALQGTGRNGRIRERDVLDAAKTQVVSPGTAGQRIVLSGRRKVIAQRLAESHRQAVPVTLTSQVDATNLVSLRTQFKSASESLVPAFHDIIAKLVAGCLKQERRLAGRWVCEDTIVLPADHEIHIGIAVDTPEGLIVPVLRNVLSEPLLTLAAESSRIIRKARDGKLSASEMQEAVFTITNLGGFGIDAFTPVINLPETAILGLGAIRRQPVVTTDDRIEVRSMMTLSLTFDHRAIDGAPAAKFLQSVVAAIENPAARLLMAE